MKLILSADQIKYPLTGTGRYAYELATRLITNPAVDSLRFLKGFRLLDEVPLPSQDSIRSKKNRIPGLLFKSNVAISLYQSISPRLKSFVLKRLDEHVFHGTSFYLPPFRGPSVATIHDF